MNGNNINNIKTNTLVVVPIFAGILYNVDTPANINNRNT